jgi:predicted small metal-binding protein
MKTLSCKDMGLQCDWVGRAETEEELLKQVAQHAKEVHQMDATPEMVAQVRKAIRDE